MAEPQRGPEAHTGTEKRTVGLRLRKYIDVVVEDQLSFTLLRAAIADISQTGMRVIADQYLPKGTKYLFTMKRNPFLALRGEVRWIRNFERDTYQVGILFVDVSEDDRKRLANFLEIERQRVTTTS
ncbi:MAG: PilZ domain-containing protein [Candidatus Eremiobacteraeota bacterium]|nr:PilZ domain-containing protein [Candidatus Eremiobacteraeota bacterium]MBV8721751.1 PilZ domain-containing protein [Candidatus Eremiobacteraeota bacterium]